MDELIKMLVSKQVEIELEYDGKVGVAILDEQDWGRIFEALKEKECKVIWHGQIFP